MVFDLYFKQYTKWFASYDRNTWNYEDACVIIGLRELYSATGDKVWWDAVKAFYGRYINEDGTIRLYDESEYNLDRIPGGRALFDLLKETGEAKYRKAIEALAGQMKRQPRAKCGSFWHKNIYPNQIWLDGLYMGLPFYMLYANLTGDASIYDDVVRQFKNAREHIFDEEKKIYYHAWDESRSIFWCDKETGLSANFWSRALGWYLMALADVYEYMPESRKEDRETIASIWKEAMDGMLLYQDKESGMFYQLTALGKTVEGNYLETSSSMMVAYSLFKGALLGVFKDEHYIDAAISALMGTAIQKFTFVNGKLSLGGMCKGAGLGPDGNFKRDGSVAYYLAEEVVADEQKGTGVSMLAYAEYIKAAKAGLIPDSFPHVELFKRNYDPILPTDPGFKATMN